MLLTSENAATPVAIGDRAVGGNTKLRSSQTIVANSILTVAKLADRGAVGGRKVETAATSAADNGISTGCKSCKSGNKSDEGLHGSNGE